jgi:RNA polymerase sigma factor (sigma-70 family)
VLDKLGLLGVLIDSISPERSVSGTEEVARLAACFDKLPPRRREAFWLRKVEEHSQKEIAQLMGIEEGTVEQHLAGAMRQLTHCFNTEGQSMARTGSRRLRPKIETEDGA